MWLWISVAVVAVLLLALVAWKVLSSSKLSNRPRRSTILGPPPQSSRTQLKSPPRYGSASIMPNRPLGNMVNPSQNQNQYPTNYSPQPSPITSSEIDNPSQDLFEHGLYDEFPQRAHRDSPYKPDTEHADASKSNRLPASTAAPSSNDRYSAQQKTRSTSTKKAHSSSTSYRVEETSYYDSWTTHADTSKSSLGLVKLKKKKPVIPRISYDEVPTEIEIPQKPVSKQKEPQVLFKSSFGNPMVMKVSYQEDSIVITVSWPPNDSDWEAKWEKRIEILSPEMPRAEYPYQNKVYIDRPDWGYRIIVWVPESEGWSPDYRMRSGAKVEGHASPISFPESSTRPAQSTMSGENGISLPIGIASKQAPTAASKVSSISSKSSPDSSTQASFPHSSPSFKFGFPVKTPTTGVTSTSSSTSPNLIPPSVTPPPDPESPAPGASEFNSEPPTAAKSQTAVQPKFGLPALKPANTPTFLSPKSEQNQDTEKTIAIVAPTPKAPNVTLQPSFPPVSGFSGPNTIPSVPKMDVNAPTTTPATVTWSDVKKPAVAFPAPLSSNPPTPTTSKPASGASGKESTPATAAASPAATKVVTLSPMLSQPIQPWLPAALSVLPPEAKAGMVVPGVGVSPAAWKDYVSVMEDFAKYKAQMTPEHAEAVKIEDQVKDISNKIGATAESFREKLGEGGLDGALLSLQKRGLLGVYYYGLERFAFKVFSEAALNKFLESESNAIKYGERIVFMLQRHPLLERFIKYWIYTKCPMAIPVQPQRRPGQSEEDYKTKELGMKPNELDNVLEYVKRTRRTMYFYASIMNTAPPDVPNPMGISTAWSYVARTLALPRSELSMWYLEPVINICTRRLLFAYGAQWTKMSHLVTQYIDVPKGAPRQFFESEPLIGAIRVALEAPTTHTPILHYADHESLMELKSRNSHKMEFEDGKFITLEQLDTIYMMSDAYHDYLDSQPGDIVDDILIELKNWDDLLDRVDSNELIIKESGPPRQYKSKRGGHRGGRGGHGGYR